MSGAIKFGSSLREVRIHLCQQSPASKGVREFIEKFYVDLKTTNPKFPILIRECSGVEPRLWARFEKGKECAVSLKELSATDVLNKVKQTVAN